MLSADVPPRLWALVALSAWLAAACAGEPAYSQPRPWTGFFHPAPLPGASINNTKQCECRACDPDICCGAEHTESDAPAPAECNSSYTFSEKCGITVQTCTPRCYSQVWRVPKQESCTSSRPAVCCE
ncbi:MAG: hypothetical protein ABUL60_18100 [Myxococcales bacterium]